MAKKVDIYQRIEDLMVERYQGWDGARQFEGTGGRLKRMVDELCWPSSRIEEELVEHFKAVFDDRYNEMLVSGPTSVWTLCPHHLVPCNFQVFIGYIPNGKVLGLSKFSRIAITVGRTPIMQEQYSRELADALMSYLKPDGVGIYVTGKHGCMGCRGVTQDINVVTTVLRGSFLKEPSVKEEFLGTVRSH